MEASSTKPIEGFKAVGALCTPWIDFSTWPIRATVEDLSCSNWSIFPDVEFFSFSS